MYRIIESTDSSIKLLPHLMSFWNSHDLKGQSLICCNMHLICSLDATPESCSHYFFCAKQNPGPKPMQMARIWWLTSFVFLLLQGNWLFLSFTLGMNYPVVFLCLLILTILSSSSPGNTWPGKIDAPITSAWRLEMLSWLCPVTRLCWWIIVIIFNVTATDPQIRY